MSTLPPVSLAVIVNVVVLSSVNCFAIISNLIPVTDIDFASSPRTSAVVAEPIEPPAATLSVARSLLPSVAVYPYTEFPFAMFAVVGVIICELPGLFSVIALKPTSNTGNLKVFLPNEISLYFII